MSRSCLAALVAALLALLIPGAAQAAPDPALVAKDATLISDGLAAWSQKSGPTDTQYYADGQWVTTSPTWFAYTQGGPASAAAVLWRYSGMTRSDLCAMAVGSIDHAIAVHQRPDGAFAGDAGDSQGPTISTNMYARELGVAYLALEPALDAAHRVSWQTAIARAADYLLNTGELSWYTNGNVELGEIELFYLAARITGQPRFAAAYEADWAFTLAPPQPRWSGFGLQQPTTARLADGADGTGYLAEAGAGAPGFDAEYTGVQLDVATRLYVLSGDPRALRVANLELNQLLPRVDASWQLDTSNGTRHTEASRKVPFLAQALAVLGGATRPDLKAKATAQWPSVEATYRGTYRYTAVTFYKNLGVQLATTLLAAMTSNGSLAGWAPPAAAAVAPTTTTATASTSSAATTAAPTAAAPAVPSAPVPTKGATPSAAPAKTPAPAQAVPAKKAPKRAKAKAGAKRAKATRKRAKATKKAKATKLPAAVKRRSTKA